MALTYIITRRFIQSKLKNPPLFPHFNRLLLHSTTAPPPCISTTKISHIFSITRTFCTPNPKKRNPKLVNFSLPSDSDSDSDTETTQQVVHRPKFPLPYVPFTKTPAIEQPEDPKKLQEVCAKILEGGVINSAPEMFDGLSQDGLTHEAPELFSHDERCIDTVAYTDVIEAYYAAGQAKEARKVYLRMLASGMRPNEDTYKVMIKGLVETRDMKMVKDARRYVMEMVGRGMKPNATTCVSVFEGLVGVGLEHEGREMLEMLKAKSVVPEERKVREALKKKSGVVYRGVMSVLYGK